MVRHHIMRRVSVVVAVVFVSTGCGPVPEPLAEESLVSKIDAIEKLTRDAPDEVVRGRVERFAEEMAGRRIRVEAAVVTHPYVRADRPDVYFGVDYDPHNYVLLENVAPDRYRRLGRHRHWVSAVRSFGTRQLEFEIAVSRGVYEQLERGQSISFVATVEGVVRGRNVFCVADTVKLGTSRG